ncbi:hypothetical protein J2X46_003284 [Nocardioides sp. BE266]|nr:hypothetical protein [Nocardioides sp. BE266]
MRIVRTRSGPPGGGACASPSAEEHLGQVVTRAPGSTSGVCARILWWLCRMRLLVELRTKASQHERIAKRLPGKPRRRRHEKFPYGGPGHRRASSWHRQEPHADACLDQSRVPSGVSRSGENRGPCRQSQLRTQSSSKSSACCSAFSWVTERSRRDGHVGLQPGLWRAVVSQQVDRQRARREARTVASRRRASLLARAKRLEDLAVEVLTALADRDAAVATAESRAAAAIDQMARVEGVPMAEAVEWCGGQLSGREAARLRRMYPPPRTTPPGE